MKHLAMIQNTRKPIYKDIFCHGSYISKSPKIDYQGLRLFFLIYQHELISFGS